MRKESVEVKPRKEAMTEQGKKAWKAGIWDGRAWMITGSGNPKHRDTASPPLTGTEVER